MTDTTATGNFYTINHIVLISGLTDRTIRSYIASGILRGEPTQVLSLVNAYYNR